MTPTERIKKNVRLEQQIANHSAQLNSNRRLIDIVTWSDLKGEHRMTIDVNQIESIGEHLFDNKGAPYNSVLVTKTGNHYFLRDTYEEAVAKWYGFPTE